jgi:CHAT domain-containing protein
MFIKGARSVVLSLWKVDDEATALLMTRFYQNLLGRRAGLGARVTKAAALDEAKSWLRRLSQADLDSFRSSRPLRGVEEDLAPAIRVVPGKIERPFEHPFFWAAFILIGDEN